MLKITGIDKLTRELDDAQKALADLDGELGTVSFGPNDPASLEAAIQEVARIIDERVGSCASNALVGPLVEQMKEAYREGILQRAAEARLKGDVQR